MRYFPPNELYIFLVDTDTYAGQFERELTAYVTGAYAECGIGEKEARLFRQECPEYIEVFDDLITQVINQQGNCFRPCSIYPTPGWYNDGYGQEYREQDVGSPEVVARYRASCEQFGHNASQPGLHPGYMSVGMFLDGRPGNALVQFMRIRAMKYARECRDGKFPAKFKIEGFRLVQESFTSLNLADWGPEL